MPRHNKRGDGRRCRNSPCRKYLNPAQVTRFHGGRSTHNFCMVCRNQKTIEAATSGRQWQVLHDAIWERTNKLLLALRADGRLSERQEKATREKTREVCEDKQVELWTDPMVVEDPTVTKQDRAWLNAAIKELDAADEENEGDEDGEDDEEPVPTVPVNNQVKLQPGTKPEEGEAGEDEEDSNENGEPAPIVPVTDILDLPLRTKAHVEGEKGLPPYSPCIILPVLAMRDCRLSELPARDS